MPTVLKRALPFVLLAIAVGFIAYQWRRISTEQRQIEADARELQALRAQLQTSARSSAAPRSAAPVEKGAGPEARKWPDSHVEDLALRTADLERTQRELAEARATIDQLNAQLQNMKADHEKALSAAEQQAGAMDARWKESLDNANLTLEGVRTDLRAAKQELVQLQAENQALREANNSTNGAAADTLRLMAQYQDLSRRREAYLNTMLQRFRDIARQYRSFAAVASAHRNDQPGPVLDDPDFSRIQGALASTQDDLRQLELLNGQAQQIERKLAKK